jgi:hypothetical protein
LPLNADFGHRPELTLYWDLATPWSFLKLRPGLRVAGPIDLRGNAMGHPEGLTLATFAQVSPMFLALYVYKIGAIDLSAGVGLAHHVRFTYTPAATQGLEIFPGNADFGHIARVDFTDHTGLEVALEGSYPVWQQLRMSLGLGFSHASVRVLAEPQEESSLVVGYWRYMTSWSVHTGLQFPLD